MRDALSQLYAAGCALCIATIKRKDLAQSVLHFLGVNVFYAQVHGCDLYRTKSDLLRNILSDAKLAANPMVMIGDRDSDFKAAAEVGIPSIAVRWGYGARDELEMATAVAERTADLPRLIERTAQPVGFTQRMETSRERYRWKSKWKR
jgi:phosphoglycolate phosphatase